MSEAQETFCPATMCPLFAKDGSPWTGDKNSKCDGPECAWFHEGNCMGAAAAVEQIGWADEGSPVLIVNDSRKRDRARPKSYECDRASECQWQAETEGLCPPRLALQKGLDPRVVAY